MFIIEKLGPTEKYNQQNVNHLIIPLLGKLHYDYVGIFLSSLLKIKQININK